MVDVTEASRRLVDRLRAEHAAAANEDAAWINELERRRAELATEAEEIFERAKRAAEGG